MVNTVTIEQIEGAINRAKESQPFGDGILPPEVRALSNIYGLMIYMKARTMDVSTYPEPTQSVLTKWIEQ